MMSCSGGNQSASATLSTHPVAADRGVSTFGNAYIRGKFPKLDLIRTA
jgi:hypothetical protein